MKTGTEKHRGKSTLLSFTLALFLWSLGTGSSVSLAKGNPLDALTLTFTATGPAEIPSPATGPDIVTPSPSATVTEENPETTSSTTPELTNTSETLPQPEGEYAPDEIVVRFKPRIGSDLEADCFAGIENSVVVAQIKMLNVFVLKVPEGNIAPVLLQVINCSGVLYAEPNYLAYAADTIPNDPDWGSQYGLVSIRAPQGWELSTGSSSITLAIVDTGIDLAHPDLSSKIVGGYDFVNNDAVAQDDNGHGTRVAGIAAAAGNNNIGIAGVSWGARLMPVKVLNAFASGTFTNVAAGIVWATDHGAQVINLSLGGNNSSQVLQNAVDYAYSKGVVVVAAAGNAGNAGILYPARYPNVIAVGAVDSLNKRAALSNYGPELDVVAPGISIYSTAPGGYGYNSGTSMSAPFVAGLAAILCGYPAGASPDAVAAEIETTALDLGAAGRDDFYGFGLIQVDSAIAAVLPPTPTETMSKPEKREIPSATSAISYGIFSLSTNTPTQTATLTLTPSLTASATVPLSPSQPVTKTPTLAPTSPPILETRSPNPIRAQEKTDNVSYLLPCLGIGFILLGLALSFLMLRWQRR